MKKVFVILLLLTAISLPLFAADAAAAATTQSAPKSQASWIQNLTNGINSVPQWIVDKIIVGTFSLFVYLVAIMLKLFNLMFHFITKYIFLLVDFSNMKTYPTEFQNIIKSLAQLVYIIAYGFLFILFVNSLLMSLYRNEDASKTFIGLFFAAVLLAMYPYIYSKIAEIFMLISQNASKLAVNSKSSEGSIINSIINISAYMGNVNEKGLTITGLFDVATKNAANANIELSDISKVVEERLKEKDFAFFINQILVFIVCLTGAIAMFEVIVLKGAQILNLFIAYFTGIFAASLVASQGLKGTFFGWLRKVCQIYSYNFFWAVIIIAVNMFGFWIVQTNGMYSGTEWKLLWLVCLLAGLKLMSKVGGIAEGLMMSQHVMEHFGQSMKNDVVMAGRTAGGALMAGAAFTAASGLAMAGAASTNAQASQRTFSDMGGWHGIGEKMQSSPALAAREALGYQSANLQELRSEKNMNQQIAAGQRPVDHLHDHFGKKYNNSSEIANSPFKRPGGPTA